MNDNNETAPEIPDPPGTPDAREGEPSAEPAASSSGLSRFERREKAASDALRTLVRDLCTDQFGKLRHRDGTLKLNLELTVDPADNWAVNFDPDVRDQLTFQLEDSEAGWGAYQEGHVYCFYCDQAACAHSRPDSMLGVFRGYDSMGKPEWCDLPQLFLEAKREDVDKLYEERPPVLSHLQYGKELKAQQLSSYGKASKTYALLGQVAAGFFRIPGPKGAGPAKGRRLALTFHVLESRDGRGAFKVSLNMIGGELAPEELSELLASRHMEWVFRAREVAQRSLGEISRLASQARDEGNTEKLGAVMRRVPGVLRIFARNLERGDRQFNRRTMHAEDRRRKNDRPVHMGLEDALTVPLDSLFYDEKHHSTVACTDSGRAHAFSPEGKHITSFRIKPDAVNLRTRTQRWRYLTPEEADQFKTAVRQWIPGTQAGG